MTWLFYVYIYIIIGVIFYLRVKATFRETYRGEMEDFAESEMPPTPFNMRPLIVATFMFIGIFLWPYMMITYLIRKIRQFLGIWEASEDYEKLEDALNDRLDELEMLDNTEERRKHYLDIINKRKVDDESESSD